MSTIDPRRAVSILYTNYKGETAVRRVVPVEIRFAETEWHPGEQWLLDAFDLEKNALRSFAIKDIAEWHQAAAAPREAAKTS